MTVASAGGLLLAALCLTACQGSDVAPGTTGRAEAQALNDAATMLDANSVDINAVSLNATEEQPS